MADLEDMEDNSSPNKRPRPGAPTADPNAGRQPKPEQRTQPATDHPQVEAIEQIMSLATMLIRGNKKKPE